METNPIECIMDDIFMHEIIKGANGKQIKCLFAFESIDGFWQRLEQVISSSVEDDEGIRLVINLVCRDNCTLIS
jgi:hypothetical protein